VDFGGGWLDAPQFARPDSFVANCAITPMVSLKKWGYEQNGGLGGSAAYNILMGNNAVETELTSGVGWQDPAVIYETGLCAWVSGPRPVLDIKTNPDWLRGLMALFWTGKPHNTPSLVSNSRNWDMISAAGLICRNAIRSSSFMTLVNGINTSYAAQRQEGMDDLPAFGEMAKKYCGGGWGGYGLFLFTNPTARDTFVGAGSGRIAVEPYIRHPGN
jgi:mevalonate kinase